MATAVKLTREDIDFAIRTGDFPSEILSSAENVAVVMTQGWCPQWTQMAKWILDLEPDMRVNVFYTVYDEESFYVPFMNFKETVFGNYQIPYVRYYRGGKLVKESNYISQSLFLSVFATKDN